jgi:hypothetical protein
LFLLSLFPLFVSFPISFLLSSFFRPYVSLSLCISYICLFLSVFVISGLFPPSVLHFSVCLSLYLFSSSLLSLSLSLSLCFFPYPFLYLFPFFILISLSALVCFFIFAFSPVSFFTYSSLPPSIFSRLFVSSFSSSSQFLFPCGNCPDVLLSAPLCTNFLRLLYLHLLSTGFYGNWSRVCLSTDKQFVTVAA